MRNEVVGVGSGAVCRQRFSCCGCGALPVNTHTGINTRSKNAHLPIQLHPHPSYTHPSDTHTDTHIKRTITLFSFVSQCLLSADAHGRSQILSDRQRCQRNTMFKEIPCPNSTPAESWLSRYWNCLEAHAPESFKNTINTSNTQPDKAACIVQIDKHAHTHAHPHTQRHTPPPSPNSKTTNFDIKRQRLTR